MSEKYVGTGVFSLIIVLVSLISRKFFVFVITKIKLQRLSEEKNTGMFWTMCVYFTNYGIMYLTAPWNYIDAKEVTNDAELFFSGYYSDFSEEWFLDIGAAILVTQCINAIAPLFEWLFFWLLRIIPRCLDQKSCCPVRMIRDKDEKSCCTRRYAMTNSKTVQRYIEIYSGPEFEQMERVTDMVVMVWVSFLFGPGQPILFWLALFYFWLQYTIDRCLMAYSYRKPPMLDNSMNKSAVWLMTFGPWLYCLFSIILFSNQSVFENEVRELTGQFSVPPASDYITTTFTTLTPSIVFIVLIVGFLMLKVFDRVQVLREHFFRLVRPSKLSLLLPNLGEHARKDEMVLNGATYCQALKWKHIDYTIREEVVGTQRFGIERLRALEFDQVVGGVDFSDEVDAKKEL